MSDRDELIAEARQWPRDGINEGRLINALADALESAPRSTGRFTPTEEELRRSLAWHASVTTDLQARIVRATEYVRGHGGDAQLLAILGPSESSAQGGTK